MIQKKCYYFQEISGEGSSGPINSFIASSLAQAKLRATRRSTGKFVYIILGDQIDQDAQEIINILAVRHFNRGWREYVGKDNPYAL